MKKEKVARFRIKKIKVLSIRRITREYQLFIISWKITTICLKVETRRSCKLSVARTSWKASICLSWFMELAPFFFSRVPQFERAAEDRVTSAKIWEKKRRRRKAKKSLDVEISSVSIPTYAQNTSFSTQNFLSLRNWAIFDFLVVIYSEKKDKIWTLMIINNSKRLFKQFTVCCSCWI